MREDGKHLGLFLSKNKPIDKQCLDVLEDIPKGYSITSYIKKAIIFYGENGNKEIVDGDVNQKLDEILKILKTTPVTVPSPIPTSDNPQSSPEPAPVPVTLDKPETPAENHTSSSPQVEKIIVRNELLPEEQDSDERISLTVNAKSSLSEDSLDELGDFLDS